MHVVVLRIFILEEHSCFPAGRIGIRFPSGIKFISVKTFRGKVNILDSLLEKFANKILLEKRTGKTCGARITRLTTQRKWN
jgi:hypothetical protein